MAGRRRCLRSRSERGDEVAAFRRRPRNRDPPGAAGLEPETFCPVRPALRWLADGLEAHGELDWRFLGRDHVIAGYQRLQRIFLGTPAAIDSLFNFEYSRLQGERSYTLFKAGFSTTHVFSPVWTAGIEPHYTLHDDSDIGLEARYSHYVGQEVALAAPSWRHVYGDWTTTVRVFITVAGSVLPSALGSVAWAMHPRFEPRFTVAGGKTLEQVNLTDKFHSLAGELGWHVRPNLIARVLGSIYRGDVRTENRVGVGGEWLF